MLLLFYKILIVKQFIKRHWLLVVSLLYFIMPFDFITDLVGPLGLVDDFGLLMILLVKELYTHFKFHRGEEETIKDGQKSETQENNTEAKETEVKDSQSSE